MKRTLLSILALFFPWIAFLCIQEPIAALAALALQLTFLGWLPATIWAISHIRRHYPTSAKKIPSMPPKAENINQPSVEKQAEFNPPPPSVKNDQEKGSQ